MLKNQKFFEDLHIGQEASIKKILREEDVIKFAQVSGDFNPVHLNENFAQKTIFKKRIAHGFLTASLISTVIASDLPGPGSIYLSQTLKFLAPVYFNDEIIVKVKIIELNKEKKRVKLLTECTKNNALILAGEAVIIVESKNQKK